MNSKDFDKLVKRRNKRTSDVLDSKNAEYASDTDKLNNFKRAGKMLRCNPEKALVGMWTKHIVSILDIVDNIDRKKCPTKELIDEKIGDAINYLILLEALFYERIDNEQD